MFERFTNKARAVLVDAQDEARELNHNFIGTEHLMLGIVRSTDPVTTQVLAGYDLTIEGLHDEITDLIGEMHEPFSGPPPFTPRSKKVLELSLREVLALGSNAIEPVHILLGVLREGSGVGAEILASHGVEYDRVRLWAGQALGEEPGFEVRGRRGRRRLRNRLDPMDLGASTAAAVRARGRAQALASTDNVGTHHLLLGLLGEDASLAGKVLSTLGVTKDLVEAKIAEIGVEGTTDAPPAPRPRPATVTLAEGVEVRISDPDLAKLAAGGQLEELLAEIIRRSKPAS